MNGASEAEVLSRIGMEVAAQVFRISLNGSVFVVRAVGKPVMNFLAAAVTGEGKTAGKARLATLLRSGKPLKIYTFREDQMKDFISAAKRYGIVYSAVKRDADDKMNHVYDIMVKAEDAPKINRVFEKINYATVDADITAEESTEENTMNLQYIHELIEKCMQPGRDNENPSQAVDEEYQYTASSNQTADRPSVVEQIEKARVVADNINSKSAGSPFTQLINQLMESNDKVEEESDIDMDDASMEIEDFTETLTDNNEHENIMEKDDYGKDFNELTQGILGTLGINRTVLTKSEAGYLNTWVNTYGFSEELIMHACDKASTAKPNTVNFAYVNGILENWNKNNVSSIEDVERLNQQFSSNRELSVTGSSHNAKGFNNFEQKKLDKELAEMEELFLREVNDVREG